MNCELSTLVEFPCLIYLTADGMIPFRMFNPAQSPGTVCRAYFKARPRKSGKSKKGSGERVLAVHPSLTCLAGLSFWRC